MARGTISVEDLSVVYNGGKGTLAIENMSFRVEASSFTCFLGTSGCGKSTLLNVLAGFIKPTSGKVWVDGKPIAGPGPDRGIVFQDHALFPWMTVRGNIAYGLKSRGVPAREVRDRTDKFLDLIGLRQFAGAYPGGISGGMQQRVGLARVLVNDPDFILMDEPFGSLDAQTRIVMQDLLLSIYREQNKTIIFVTHDIDEAILLADKLYVLTSLPGRIKKEIQIHLPRPRKHVIFTSPAFIDIKKEVMDLIQEETMKAMSK